MTPFASVIIPAHDEARSLAGNLRVLHWGFRPGVLDVVVVCNGCTDDTAEVARSFPGVRVIEVPEASKSRAVRLGNLATDIFPRVHLDADVALTGPDLRRLVAPLQRDASLLAAAPRRRLVTAGSSWQVRWYYQLWEELPNVQAGLFGRGAIALSRKGQQRVDALPDAMSDDLAVSDAFEPRERCVVATSVAAITAPATLDDLVRRRTRVATGNAQAAQLGLRRRSSMTTWGVLCRLVVRRPALALRLPVFLAVTVVARASARHAVAAGDFGTWLRDESSRAEAR